jgi:hypothetical protein
MSAHTPGPWAAQIIKREGAKIVGVGPFAPVGCTVAWVGADDTEQLASGRVVERLSQEAQANANIIAAAPDLLAIIEALVSMRDESDFTYEGAYEAFHKGGAEEVWERARAAIAKARGGK